MASKSLTFDIYGKDKSASKTIRGVGNAAESTGARFKKAGVAIGIGLAAVGVAALKFGADSVQAFADADAAQRKLGFAFEKFPALADTNQKALQKLNTEIQKKTRFDDDALAAAQANLASFGLTGAQLKQLTPLLTDYAAKTGKDVVTASTDLGKAIFGQGRALQKAGIDFQDTGTAAGNFQELINGLSGTVGGFALTDVETASGKLENMKNRFGEIQEKIGEILMPVLDELATKLQDKVLPAIEAFMNATTDEAKQGEIDNFMVVVGDKLANGAAQWGVKLNLGAQQWGDKLNLGLQQWGEKLANGWNQISGWFLGSVDAWGASLENGLNQITGWWNSSVAQWGGALANGWAQISGFFGTIADGISNFGVTVGANAMRAGATIVNNIVSGIRGAIGSVSRAMTDVMNTIASFLPHSPAKQGPFSGAGWASVASSGAALANQFTVGFDSNAAITPSFNAPSMAGGSGSSGAASRTAASSLDGMKLTLVVGDREFNAYVQSQAGTVVKSYDKSNQGVATRGYAGE